MRSRSRTAFLLAAVIGTLGLLLGAILAPRATAFAYLTSLVFALGIALGGLMLLAIMHAARARWFIVVRRLAEMTAGTLPVLAALFVPVLLVLPELYPWARPLSEATREEQSVFAHRGAWMSPLAFVLRTILYFGVWIALSEIFLRASLRQAGDRIEGRRMHAYGAAGLWPLGLTLTFASFDWIMSLDPLWSSTMSGIRFFASSMLAALAALILAARAAQSVGLLAGKMTPNHYSALGRLLLTFLLFWAYAAFCEYLIVYMADLPEEVPYYLRRTTGIWWWVTLFLIGGRFFLPFFLLLSRELKFRARVLAGVAAWVLVGHYVEAAWLVLPPAGIEGSSLGPQLAALLAVLGIGVTFGLWRVRGRALYPQGDPDLELAARYHP